MVKSSKIVAKNVQIVQNCDPKCANRPKLRSNRPKLRFLVPKCVSGREFWVQNTLFVWVLDQNNTIHEFWVASDVDAFWIQNDDGDVMLVVIILVTKLLVRWILDQNARSYEFWGGPTHLLSSSSSSSLLLHLSSSSSSLGLLLLSSHLSSSFFLLIILSSSPFILSSSHFFSLLSSSLYFTLLWWYSYFGSTRTIVRPTPRPPP